MCGRNRNSRGLLAQDVVAGKTEPTSALCAMTVAQSQQGVRQENTMSFWVGLLIAVAFLSLGMVGGFLFACLGIWHLARTKDFIKGEWVKREKTRISYSPSIFRIGVPSGATKALAA